MILYYVRRVARVQLIENLRGYSSLTIGREIAADVIQMEITSKKEKNRV